jgi:hypothetical protein
MPCLSFIALHTFSRNETSNSLEGHVQADSDGEDMAVSDLAPSNLVSNDDEFNSVMRKILLMSNANVDEMRVHNETWAQQFKDAMVVNGGDIENASAGDYIMHFLTFGFKVGIFF